MGLVAKTDIYAANVSLLLPFDADFTDHSVTPKTVTAFGNAAVSATQKKYGAKSCYFDGTGDYLSTPAHASLQLDSGDFTIDFWFYGEARTNRLMGNRGGSIGWLVAVSPGTDASWNQWTSGGVLKTATGPTPVADAWNHIAFVRLGDNVTVYVNGVPGTALNTTERPGVTTSNFNVGRDVIAPTTAQTLGYIDELRITTGIARYTSDFSASLPTSFFQWEETAPLTTIAPILFSPYTSPWEENIPLTTLTPQLFQPFTSPWQENVPHLVFTPQLLTPSSARALILTPIPPPSWEITTTTKRFVRSEA